MSAVFMLGVGAAPGIFAGALVAETLNFKGTVLAGSGIALGNTLAPIIAVYLLRLRVGRRSPFRRVKSIFQFVVACATSGLISAMIGGSFSSFSLGLPFVLWRAQWFDWIISDTAAAILLVPLVYFLWYDPPDLSSTRKHLGELAITVVLSLLSVGYLLTRHQGNIAATVGASVLILLPLLWAAQRFSIQIAYPLFLADIAIVVERTVAGYGPYVGLLQRGTLLIFSEMTIGCGAALLLLGAAAEEQRTAEHALRELNQELESRVEQRTAELRKSQQQLEKAAFHDVLTGLPNRRYLEDRFASYRSVAERSQKQFAFLLIDLDRFKEINDTLGHDAGDALLVEAARRLSVAVRQYDFVARLGGDEFAVILSGTEEGDIDAICGRIVDGMSDCIFFDGKEICSTPSVGVAVFPEDGRSWHELYNAADLALYRAKRLGRARWEWFRADEALASALP